MQMHKNSKAEKYYKLISLVLMVFLVLDIVNNTYGLLWYLYSHGFPVLFQDWVQYTIVDLINLFLLIKSRLKVFGLVMMALVMIGAIIFSFESHSANVVSMLQSGELLSAIVVISWWLALGLSIVGLLIWWKLHIARKNGKTS